MGGRRVTKASVQLREEQAPLVRVKLPVAFRNAPVFAGCTVGGAPHELALHLGTLFSYGPSLRLTYRPIPSPASSAAASGANAEDDVAEQQAAGLWQPPGLVAVLKAGLGRWGDTHGAALSMKLEVDVMAPRNSRFQVKLEPRLGDLSLHHFPLKNTPAPGAPLRLQAGSAGAGEPGPGAASGAGDPRSSGSEAPRLALAPGQYKEGVSALMALPQVNGSSSSGALPDKTGRNSGLGDALSAGPKSQVDRSLAASAATSSSSSSIAAPHAHSMSSPATAAGGRNDVMYSSPEQASVVASDAGQGGPWHWGTVGVKECQGWVQRVRTMHNWDIAIRSTVPLNPNAVARARWRLRLPADSVSPSDSAQGLGLTLSALPVLVLDKLSLQLYERPAPAAPTGGCIQGTVASLPFPSSAVPGRGKLPAGQAGSPLEEELKSIREGNSQIREAVEEVRRKMDGAPLGASASSAPASTASPAPRSGWGFWGRGKGKGNKDAAKESQGKGPDSGRGATNADAKGALKPTAQGIPEGGLLGVQDEPWKVGGYQEEFVYTHDRGALKPLNRAEAGLGPVAPPQRPGHGHSNAAPTEVGGGHRLSQSVERRGKVQQQKQQGGPQGHGAQKQQGGPQGQGAQKGHGPQQGHRPQQGPAPPKGEFRDVSEELRQAILQAKGFQDL